MAFVDSGSSALIDFEDQKCYDWDSINARLPEKAYISDDYNGVTFSIPSFVYCDSEIAHSGSRYIRSHTALATSGRDRFEMTFDPLVQLVQVWAGEKASNFNPNLPVPAVPVLSPMISMTALDRDDNIISVVGKDDLNETIDTLLKIHSDMPNIYKIVVEDHYDYGVYIDDIYFQEHTSFILTGGEGGSSSGSPSSFIRTDVPDIDFTTYPPKIKPVPSVDGYAVIDDDKIVIVPGDVFVVNVSESFLMNVSESLLMNASESLGTVLIAA